ncbi:cysteine-rich VLP protein, partial [Clostridioides difficile]
MTGVKRLTPPQSRKVNSLVKKECCNCDNGHCILLDDGEECVCPQLISYSLL